MRMDELKHAIRCWTAEKLPALLASEGDVKMAVFAAAGDPGTAPIAIVFAGEVLDDVLKLTQVYKAMHDGVVHAGGAVCEGVLLAQDGPGGPLALMMVSEEGVPELRLHFTDGRKWSDLAVGAFPKPEDALEMLKSAFPDQASHRTLEALLGAVARFCVAMVTRRHADSVLAGIGAVADSMSDDDLKAAALLSAAAGPPYVKPIEGRVTCDEKID